MATAAQPMTAGQLAAVLSDVAQATLYRHIKLLADAGILKVVEERPMRGTTEKVYRLDPMRTYLSPQDAAEMTPDDHRRSFVMFITSLLGDYERYLQQEVIAPQREVSFQKLPIYMSDEEFAVVRKTISDVLLPLLHNPPGAGRKRRLLATILLPDADDRDIDDTQEPAE